MSDMKFEIFEIRNVRLGIEVYNGDLEYIS
jgi:hypothetical protein